MNPMFFKTVLLLSIVSVINGDGCKSDCCPTTPTKLYEDLGCIPIKTAGECCASRYDCSAIEKISNSTCYFNGRIYKNGEDLAEDVSGSNCAAACRCTASDQPARFSCGDIECPDLFSDQRHCVKQFNAHTCCADTVICEKEEINKLATCDFEGTTYRLGERMYPKNNPCHHCVCSKDFDGAVEVPENKHCTQIDCGTQLRSLHKIQGNCIPIYYGSDGCCPIEWRCPKGSDTLVSEGRIEPVSDDANMKCTFGNLSMNIGDSLNDDSQCLTCKCLIPPMASCVRDPKC